MRKLLSTVAIIIVLLNFNNPCKAQLTCTVPVPRLPRMFVSTADGNTWRDEFVKAVPSKYDLLTRANGTQDLELFYTRNALHDLFARINKKEGIRIYFARYSDCTGSTLPATPGTMILLFAEENLKVHPSVYYFIENNKDRLYPVSAKCGDTWIADYATVDLKALLPTVDNETDNHDPTSPAGYSDTKSIQYDSIAIAEAFDKEVDFQNISHDKQIVSFRASYSAYTKDGRTSIPNYKRRMFLQFDYMYEDVPGHLAVLDLEQEADFHCRTVQTIIRQKSNKLSKKQLSKLTTKQLQKKLLDNGQLCPTYCPR